METSEYCPILSMLRRGIKSPILFGVLCFALGVTLTVALGKSDIEKAIWFTAGTAITAVATAYQTNKSNQRALDERLFREKMEATKRESEDRQRLNESTLKLRIEVYEYFAACLSRVFENVRDKAGIDKLLYAATRMRLIAPDHIAELSNKAWPLANSLHREMLKKCPDIKAVDNNAESFGGYMLTVVEEMRKDIDRSSICLNPHVKTK